MGKVVRFGIDLSTRRPVEILRPILRTAHSLTVGKSRSKKTSLFVSPLALQLITPRHESSENVVICDLGGDPALYHRVAARCKTTGRKLALFSTNEGDQSLYFDFFGSSSGAFDPIKKANALLEALAIPKQKVYGAQWFWFNAYMLALSAIRDTVQAGQPLTLAAVYETMKRRRSEYRDADQIILAVGLLMAYKVLNFDEPRDPSECVSFDRLDREGEVLFIHAPTLNNPSASYVASLLLHGLISDRMERVYRGENPPHTHVIVDEMQCLSSQQWGETLSQSAKYGLTYHLACQTMFQLAEVDRVLPEILLANTSVQTFLTPDNETESCYLQQHAKEVARYLSSQTVRGRTLDVDNTQRETLMPELDHNTILEMAKRAGCAIMVLRDKASQAPRPPVLLFTDHDIPYALHSRLSHTPLPRCPVPPPVAPSQGWKDAKRDAAFLEREARLRALFVAKVGNGSAV